jgi:hypothetical protein
MARLQVTSIIILSIRTGFSKEMSGLSFRGFVTMAQAPDLQG